MPSQGSIQWQIPEMTCRGSAAAVVWLLRTTPGIYHITTDVSQCLVTIWCHRRYLRDSSPLVHALWGGGFDIVPEPVGGPGRF